MSIILVNAGMKNVTTEYYPPLGLAYLAAQLRLEEIPVKILDLVIEPEKEVRKEISAYNFVGVYFNTVNLQEALEVVKVAKEEGKITILGGPHASFDYLVCMEHKEVDYIIRGEGENVLPILVKKLLNGDNVEDINSLVFRDKENNIRVNELENLIEDLDSLPLPARDLLPMNRYLEKNSDTSIIASRGCPYHCDFCVGTLMGRNRYRRRSVQSIIAEMDEVINIYKFSRITFFDDIFTIDESFANELCENIKKQKWNIKLSCETRVDRVNEKVLRNMAEAGFDRLFFGVESGHQEILNKYNKGTKLEDVRTAVQICKNVGIAPMLSFIIGLPEDTEETIVQTIKFACDLQVSKVWFQPFTPFPGTKAYEEAKENGLIESIKPEYYNLRTVVIGTKHLSKNEIEKLYFKAILSVYDNIKDK